MTTSQTSTSHETTPHETMADAVRRCQEAYIGALRIWADSFQWYLPTSDAKLHKTAELVDKVFDYYHHVLSGQRDYYHHVLVSQREYTKDLLAVTTSAATKAASAAQDAAQEVQGVVRETAPKRDMHDGAKEATLKRG